MRLTKTYVKMTAMGILLCVALTGCGSEKKSTSGNNSNSVSDAVDDTGDAVDNVLDDAGNAADKVADDAGNAVEDAADGVGNVVEDTADGVGNVVEDAADGVGNAVNKLLGSDGFDNYNDAQDYFLNSMSSYHADATFEIRNADRELNDYQEGSKGYHFFLYDTSKNEDGSLFGEFYVDANSGQIFQKDKNGKIIEYPDQAQAKGSQSKTANNTTKKNTKQTKSSSDAGMH